MLMSPNSYESRDFTARTSEGGIGFSSKISPTSGAFSPAKNRAVLTVGLACSCVSLVAAFIALRWFVLMRRSFRHRLVLFLIASDTFKATWYFTFAVVSFASGPVRSSSAFCQASGYLLLLAIEASDFAVLMIALHTVLHIFMPVSKTGEGGLYPYRNWIYLFWLGPPFLAASLAFVQGPEAYVTSGTYCFLPKRPIWYRLALSWIPRYLIITTILVMYASIYIYVHVKFHSFRSLAKEDDNYGSASRRLTGPDPLAPDPVQHDPVAHDTVSQQPEQEKIPELPEPPLSPPKLQFARPTAFRMHFYNSLLGLGPKEKTQQESAPWDAMSFITTKPLQDKPSNGVASEDFAARDRNAGSAGSEDIYVASPLRIDRAHSVPNNVFHDSRKTSEVPTVSTMNTSYTGDTATTATTHLSILTTPPPADGKTVDPLRNTRVAIRRQLRFLFIYPLIYLLMWAFPFANHILNYSNHYVIHPPFWLSIVQTMSLALQAGVDSVVFSLREKPWRKVDENSRFSIPFLGRKVSEVVGGSKNRSAQPSFDRQAVQSENQRSSHWWEAEGRKRKDSIWMGTDLLNRITSPRETRAREEAGRGSQRSGRSGRSGA